MFWNDEVSIPTHPRSLSLATAIHLLLIGGVILALLTFSACQQGSSPLGSHGSTPSPTSKPTQPSQGNASLCSTPEIGYGVIEKIDTVSTSNNAGGDQALGALSLSDPTQKGFPAGSVNLIVTVLASTHIFRQQGTRYSCQTLHAVSFLDLKVGQKIRVWSEIVLTSYPGQAAASALVIVP